MAADLVGEAVGLAALLEVGATGLGGDREARWHRQPEVGHLGEVRTLAAEEVPLVPVALGEVEDEGGHHGDLGPKSSPAAGVVAVKAPIRCTPGTPPRLESAASIRRAVKSAQRSRTSSRVQNSAARISRACFTIRSVISGGWAPPSKTRQSASSHPPHGGSQSVSSRSPAGRLQPELLLDLALDGELGRLADLDDAAGQVPVLLVRELAEQHPLVGVADQHLADRPLAGEERVQQRAEAGRVRDRGVVGEAGENDDPSSRRGPRCRRPRAYSLAAQAGTRGDPQRGLVGRLDLRLDPAQSPPALARRGRGPVGEHAHGAGGVPVAAVPGVQRPGQLAVVVVAAAGPRSFRRRRRRGR